ncbi:MAG: hypothetical protein MUF62_09170 [Chitinophagaceae bacterium]|nr:hypothetical protein [Chitinophagaceae bacterium]
MLFRLTLFSVLFSLSVSVAFAQKRKADSLANLLSVATSDTDRVNLLWQWADVTNSYDPKAALAKASEALNLAHRIKYQRGEAKALGMMANVFLRIGNYSQALDLYLQKLRLEEQWQEPRSLASTVMNIGIAYAYDAEYDNALLYYRRADSISKAHNLQDWQYNLAVNTGDLYDRMGKADSAFYYFNQSLQLALAQQEPSLQAISQVGLANTLYKQQQYALAAEKYWMALPVARQSEDEELQTEAMLGLAKTYLARQLPDSALQYARQAKAKADEKQLLTRQLEAATFLYEFYLRKDDKVMALQQLQQVQMLKDSVFSRETIRQTLILSTNEQERQRQQAEAREKAAIERSQQLQYLFISIFIPAFFLLTVFLSRKRVNARVVRFAGIISLLFLFEFLTLLLHPQVAELTHHNPVYELLIFVSIASFLIPAHHRIEHWLVRRLTETQRPSYQLKLSIKKLRRKKPPAG